MAPVMKRPRPTRRWLCLSLCLLLGLHGGCQTPPGRLAGCNHDDSVLGRKGVLARQLVVDTAVAGAADPLHSCYHVFSELGVDLRALAAGVYYKWVVLPLSPEPPPIDPDRPTLDPADRRHPPIRQR
jgi:hypothetical protein